jgi:flagellar biosynthesis chaperone FliJ
MDKLIELRRQLSQAQQAQNQAVERLNETVAEQERIRANLAAVSAQSTLGQRFSEQLAQQEDQIASQRKAVQEQRDAVQKARQAFEKGLAELA